MTGLRVGESVHQLIEEVDLSSGWLHVRNKTALGGALRPAASATSRCYPRSSPCCGGLSAPVTRVPSSSARGSWGQPCHPYRATATTWNGFARTGTRLVPRPGTRAVATDDRPPAGGASLGQPGEWQTQPRASCARCAQRVAGELACQRSATSCRKAFIGHRGARTQFPAPRACCSRREVERPVGHSLIR